MKRILVTDGKTRLGTYEAALELAVYYKATDGIRLVRLTVTPAEDNLSVQHDGRVLANCAGEPAQKLGRRR
jgi:hypothetical protein